MKVIPIYQSDYGDKEKIRRYQIVIRGYQEDLARLRKSRNWAWAEGYVLGLATMLFIWWFL